MAALQGIWEAGNRPRAGVEWLATGLEGDQILVGSLCGSKKGELHKTCTLQGEMRVGRVAYGA